MIGFIVGALLLLAATIGLLAWPLLRRSTPAGVSTRQLTAAVYRNKLAELDQDLAAGSLSPADHELSRAELQRRLLEDSSAAEADAAAPLATAPATVAAALPRSKALLLSLATLLPLATVGLYLAIGKPEAIQPADPHGGRQISRTEIDAMVAGLAAKLEKEPDNHRGWAMLGRSYKTMGRFQEAAQAYARTGPMLDNSADLLVDYADAVAAAHNGFNPQALQLLDKALKLDPNQLQGLWMRGTAAFQAGRFDAAIADWEKLLSQLPAESEDAKAIQGNIAQAKKQAGGK